MKIAMMHKVTADHEAGAPVAQRIITEMNALMGDMMGQGVLKDGDGLHNSSKRMRVSKNGIEQRGPYKGVKEFPAALVEVRVRHEDEAIAWARRVADLTGEVELGLVVEGWDLGMMPKPNNAPLRYLILPRENADLSKVLADMRAADVLVKEAILQPTGQRTWYKAGRRGQLLDGPFAESKELISGFCIVEVAAQEEVWPWADRYGAILGDIEVDIRPLA